jgi:hypothetical protein
MPTSPSPDLMTISSQPLNNHPVSPHFRRQCPCPPPTTILTTVTLCIISWNGDGLSHGKGLGFCGENLTTDDTDGHGSYFAKASSVALWAMEDKS